MPGRPGSAHPLTPRETNYVRTSGSGDTSVVNATVHVADRDTPAGGQHGAAPTPPSTRIMTLPTLPPGHNYKELTSPEDVRKAKNFIEHEYGSPMSFTYPSTTKFFGITGSDGNIKAAGEINRFSWHTSEIRHVVVGNGSRGVGLGRGLLTYLESKTESPLAMLVSKLPQIKRVMDTNGYNEVSNARGSSGDNLATYIKTLDPSSEHASLSTQSTNHVATGRPESPAVGTGRFQEVHSSTAKTFIETQYGAQGLYKFPETSTFHALKSSSGETTVAVGEVNKVGWYMSEVKHLTVMGEYRHMGFGQKTLQHIETQVPSSAAMFASKTPQMKLIAKARGFQEISSVKGPSGKNVSIYVKTLIPSSDYSGPGSNRRP